jgi:hypothetical protein
MYELSALAKKTNDGPTSAMNEYMVDLKYLAVQYVQVREETLSISPYSLQV